LPLSLVGEGSGGLDAAYLFDIQEIIALNSNQTEGLLTPI